MGSADQRDHAPLAAIQWPLRQQPDEILLGDLAPRGLRWALLVASGILVKADPWPISVCKFHSRNFEGLSNHAESGATLFAFKSALTFAAPRRLRDKEHLRQVAKQPCLVCGRKPSEPHHLRFAQPRAMGRKVSDEFAVPLCRIHHRLLHRVGNELAWWKEAGIDPLTAAVWLWKRTRLEDAPSQPKQLKAPAAAPSSPERADTR